MDCEPERPTVNNALYMLIYYRTFKNRTSEKAKQTSKTCPVLKNGAPKFGQSMS